MDKHIAEQFIKSLLDLSEPLSAATNLTFEIGDEAERAKMRKGIGEIMGIVYVDLMRPIIKQYPDLDPDKSQK